MNKRSLQTYFMLKANRDIFIKKIEEREKLESKYKINLNKDIDLKHKDILINWKNKTNKEKLDFCKEVLDAPRDNSLKVVAEKKTEIDLIMQNSKDSVKGKIKKIIDKIGEDKD